MTIQAHGSGVLIQGALGSVGVCLLASMNFGGGSAKHLVRQGCRLLSCLRVTSTVWV